MANWEKIEEFSSYYFIRALLGGEKKICKKMWERKGEYLFEKINEDTVQSYLQVRTPLSKQECEIVRKSLQGLSFALPVPFIKKLKGIFNLSEDLNSKDQGKVKEFQKEIRQLKEIIGLRDETIAGQRKQIIGLEEQMKQLSNKQAQKQPTFWQQPDTVQANVPVPTQIEKHEPLKSREDDPLIKELNDTNAKLGEDNDKLREDNDKLREENEKLKEEKIEELEKSMKKLEIEETDSSVFNL